MQSPLDEFHKEQQEAFASYLSTAKGIESRMRGALAELSEKRLELVQALDDAKQAVMDLSRQKSIVAEKLEEARALQADASAKLKELEVDRKNLQERSKQLDTKQKYQADEHIRLMTIETGLKSRETTLEMEERRLKYFEHKLNLISSDTKIKAELERAGK